MGVRSAVDISGSRMGGVTLGIPAVDEVTGERHWDGGVPQAVVTRDGMVVFDNEETPDAPITEFEGVTFPAWVQPGTVITPGDPGRPPGTEGPDDPGVPATPDVVSPPYAVDVVVEHGDNGELWISTTADNVWEPGVSAWQRWAVSGAPQPWVQPTGGHDAYQLDDQVTHNGDTWRSTVADNVWEPGVYGWEIV